MDSHQLILRHLACGVFDPDLDAVGFHGHDAAVRDRDFFIEITHPEENFRFVADAGNGVAVSQNDDGIAVHILDLPGDLCRVRGRKESQAKEAFRDRDQWADKSFAFHAYGRAALQVPEP